MLILICIKFFLNTSHCLHNTMLISLIYIHFFVDTTSLLINSKHLFEIIFQTIYNKNNQIYSLVAFKSLLSRDSIWSTIVCAVCSNKETRERLPESFGEQYKKSVKSTHTESFW